MRAKSDAATVMFLGALLGLAGCGGHQQPREASGGSQSASTEATSESLQQGSESEAEPEHPPAPETAGKISNPDPALPDMSGEGEDENGEAETNANCGALDVPAKIVFEWLAFDPASLESVVAEDHTLHGRVENKTDTSMFVRVRIDGDAGTNHNFMLPTRILELEPHGSQSIEIDVREFGFDHESQQFSGRFLVKLVAFESLDSPLVDVTYAGPVFFHPDQEALAFYGSRALLEVHHAGDFAQREEIDESEGTRITRIVSGTRVEHSAEQITVESLEAEGDDAAPSVGEEMVE